MLGLGVWEVWEVVGFGIPSSSAKATMAPVPQEPAFELCSVPNTIIP